MSLIRFPHRGRWVVCMLALGACQTGCTSALTTAYLRDALWDTAEHATESAPPAEDKIAATSTGPDADAPDAATDARADDERRAAAIEEAVERLSRIGALDAAAQAALVDTLQRTQQEDWPVVIEAFSSSLASPAAPPASDIAAAATQAAEPAAEPHVVAKADLDAPAAAPEAAAPVSPPEPEAAAPEPIAAVAPAQPAAETPLPPEPAAAAAERPRDLAIQNACFASRVQAWGVVERFLEDRFDRGQEVIVYFELDNLSAGTSPAGHTTCIDTTIVLTGPDGGRVHDWTFEPIAETCHAQRRDYFARYVVRIPETAPAGACRVELAVTDTLTGTRATATLPLDIAAR